jgi:hypothetical protein
MFEWFKKLKIPKQYKDELRQAWSCSIEFYQRQVSLMDSSASYGNYHENPLCEKYLVREAHVPEAFDCTGCPFDIFRKHDKYGCVRWIDKYIKNRVFMLTPRYVCFYEKNEDKALSQLGDLSKIILSKIEWVYLTKRDYELP